MAFLGDTKSVVDGIVHHIQRFFNSNVLAKLDEILNLLREIKALMSVSELQKRVEALEAINSHPPVGNRYLVHGHKHEGKTDAKDGKHK